MKKSLLSLAVVFVIALTVVPLNADEKKDGDKPKAVEALPPHPLDSAFTKAKTERDISNALLNHPLYKKAIAAALKAKKEQEERFKKNPRLADASPDQAARRAFLDMLTKGKGE